MIDVLKYTAISDVGCVRENNEDMAYVAGRMVRDGQMQGETTLASRILGFAVADGMGGYEGGEVASDIVCRAFDAFINKIEYQSDAKLIEDVKAWAEETNKLVVDSAALRPELAEMGTTFVGLVFAGAKLLLVNVGDSRCYRIRGGVLKQLSVDHSERERTGNLNVPGNLIYNFMGISPECFVSDVTEYRPLFGDVYLLCSDGLSDMISEEAIEENITSAARLVELAKKAGGKDNITIVKLEL
ncbi:MAG: protein phosphatase 2C domain-containing protein [Prevotellaceae bacterium]|nr:protein phosphatase 2C domain-containing protein [Prevotellaceae bacterium]